MPCAAYLPTIPRGYSPRVTWLLDRLGQIGADPDDDEETRQSKALLVLSGGPHPADLAGMGDALPGPGRGVGPGRVRCTSRSPWHPSACSPARANFELLLRIQLLDITAGARRSRCARSAASWRPAPLACGASWRRWARSSSAASAPASAGSSLFAVVFLASGHRRASCAAGRPRCRAGSAARCSRSTWSWAARWSSRCWPSSPSSGRTPPQERAENLLLNILPRSIAEQLKAKPETIADQFTAASVLFADVVDFTPRRAPAARRGGRHARPAVRPLRQLAERYGLEKIKTIGDCYMVAAGVPTPRPDHARALALVALDMLEAVRAGGRDGRPGLRAADRHQLGPVVAGVIGRKRSSTTCGATRSTPRAGWNRRARPVASRSRARPTSC